MNEQKFPNQKQLKVLNKRANILANATTKTQEKNHETTLVFHIGSTEKYGICFESIEKVIEAETITKIPCDTEIFSGVLYHNSQVWPVIKAKKLFNIRVENNEIEENLILIKKPPLNIALQINEIIEQVSINEKLKITDPKATTTTMIEGIYRGDIAIIDVNAMIKKINTIHF